ncbi:uncharacterized protein FIBRA_01113 [Fibroporia radiculosa]|uniref:PH domain-containing protein n=1 Tax=Fibroporia radiculosa TaxID=599839 RepID=J4H0X3_9APHY|nr:uncharacterized protein FIBRA_01113 [Fibroporia radiculosa]CCL99099.1 predicted protein [Fibroporia radiculosa]
MSSVGDASSEIFSLYSYPEPLTRASSSAQDSNPPITPPDETAFVGRGGHGVARGKLHALQDTVQISSTTPERSPHFLREPRLDALAEVGEPEQDPEPYGPYFSLRPDPTSFASPSGLSRRGTTKELIGRYESITSRSNSVTTAVTTDITPKVRPGAYPAIERKEKGRSPIRQSIRNILSVFKKNKSANSCKEQANFGSPAYTDLGRQRTASSDTRSSSVAPPLKLNIPKERKDFSLCQTPLGPSHARHSGTLFYLSRPASPIIHSTAHGNPSTDIISFKECTDVRSLSISELNLNEQRLLPSDVGELKVFELLFEGRPREKFAANSVPARATWVSAIWDAILQAQDEKSSTSRNAANVVNSLSEETNFESRRSQESRKVCITPMDTVSNMSAKPVNRDRTLPDIPRRPPSPVTQSAPPRLSLKMPPSTPGTSPLMPSVISPLPKPPTTPNKPPFLSPISPPRSQSPSIRNLDQRSVVKQRLAQLESARSSTSSVYDLGPPSPVQTSATPLRTRNLAARREVGRSSSLQEQPGRSKAHTPIIDSYCVPDTPSALSQYSGRLTSLPPTSNTASIDLAPWMRSTDGSVSPCELASSDLGMASPASKYSTDETADQGQTQPSDAPQPARDIQQHRRPIIRLDTSATAWKPPIILRDEPRPEVDNHHSADQHAIMERIDRSVQKLERHNEADATKLVDIRMKVAATLEEVRRQARERDVAGHVDLSTVMEKLDMIRSELKETNEAEEARLQPAERISPAEWSELHAKVDSLVTACHNLQHTELPDAKSSASDESSQQIEEIIYLLRDAQTQWATHTEQQTDSVRYLNELNNWLETFVNHGTSQIETVAAGIHQLCQDLGYASDVQELANEGEPKSSGNLLADIRQLLIQNRDREENSATLHASVNGLIAAVQEDLRKNAEARNMLTTESVVGLIDRQRLDHERMLRTLGTELSNEIRGERLRFVEAMKEATAINVQIHVEEFKKELTREVLIMTQEVGRLQRERQGLEQQIADLFAFFAKQKQAGSLLQPTSRPNVQPARHQIPIPTHMPGSMPSHGQRRPLPSPTVASRPASSLA